jgi:voltage-gated potassium channel
MLFKGFPGQRVGCDGEPRSLSTQEKKAQAPGRRVRRNRIPSSFWVRAAYSVGLIAAVVLMGTLGMNLIEGWSYLDSFYFTSFIATGQGPPGNLLPDSPTGKIFASLLAFVSVGTVITALLFLFGPFLGRVLRAGEERLEELGREVEEFERG